MLKVKVGVMPGKLVEVVAAKGTTARELFETANVEVSNHEVRLDGNRINIDTEIQEGNLLVAMKMIKGNINTIKVGVMPGRLTEIALAGELTARELFAMAEVEVSNHEIRLDGVKIDLDQTVETGNLLVAMKMIKGNSSDAAAVEPNWYAKGYNEEEIEILLGVGTKVPTVLPSSSVSILNEYVIIDLEDTDYVIINKDVFESVYSFEPFAEQDEYINVTEEEMKEMLETNNIIDDMFEPDELPEREQSAYEKLNLMRDDLIRDIDTNKTSLQYYKLLVREYETKIEVLESILERF